MTILHDPAESREPLERVSRRTPCPVCGKADWCSFSRNGHLAICMRVSGAKPTPNSGRLHFLDNHPSPAPPPSSPAKLRPPPHDWPTLASEFHHAGGHHLPALARLLGLPPATLHGFGVGWATRARLNEIGTYLKSGSGAWTMPMRDGQGRTVALASLGLNAVGRSSCRSDVKVLCDYAARRQVEQAMILADRDEPGYDGALAFAPQLCRHVDSVRVDVPPDPHKDARAWVAGGATRAAVEAILTRPPQHSTTAGYAEGGVA